MTFLLGRPIFRGELAVSFREGTPWVHASGAIFFGAKFGGAPLLSWMYMGVEAKIGGESFPPKMDGL